MNDCVNLKLLHNMLSEAHIMNIALHQLHLLGHSFLMSGGKIIINNGSIATFLQLLHYMGADITSAACNKNIHLYPSFFLFLENKGTLKPPCKVFTPLHRQ